MKRSNPGRKWWGTVSVQGVRVSTKGKSRQLVVEVCIKGKWLPVIESFETSKSKFNLQITASAIKDRLRR